VHAGEPHYHDKERTVSSQRQDETLHDGGAGAPRNVTELREPPAVAQVREEDLEPHAGLRYIARLFKGLAILIAFMLIAEIVIGLQQDGSAAIGLLLVQATRLIVFAGMLWGAGDIALMLIESNHDLRATRILLGRVNNKLDGLLAGGAPAGALPGTRADSRGDAATQSPAPGASAGSPATPGAAPNAERRVNPR
jgi:hypothetical protein